MFGFIQKKNYINEKGSTMIEGSIIFLGKRKFKLFSWKSWISNLISLFQGGEDNITHTAVIYRVEKNWFVRSMDIEGNKEFSLSTYINKYKDRIKSIKVYPRKENEFRLNKFNSTCQDRVVKYDIINLLFVQPFKHVFRCFYSIDTPAFSICSEDTCRMVNILSNDTRFDNCEIMSPVELYEKIKNWKEIKELFTYG